MGRVVVSGEEEAEHQEREWQGGSCSRLVLLK